MDRRSWSFFFSSLLGTVLAKTINEEKKRSSSLRRVLSYVDVEGRGLVVDIGVPSGFELRLEDEEKREGESAGRGGREEDEGGRERGNGRTCSSERKMRIVVGWRRVHAGTQPGGRLNKD